MNNNLGRSLSRTVRSIGAAISPKKPGGAGAAGAGALLFILLVAAVVTVFVLIGQGIIKTGDCPLLYRQRGCECSGGNVCDSGKCEGGRCQ